MLPVLLGLPAEFAHAGLSRDLVLPLQIVSLTWIDLHQESNRVSVPKGLYQSRLAGLPQSCFRTCELLLR
jgi:hypothetical protein